MMLFLFSRRYLSCIFLLVTILSVAHTQEIGGQCASYPGGVCSDYINYPVFLPPGANFSIIETQLSQLAAVDTQLGKILPACVEAFYRFTCPFYYQECTTISSQPAILGACESSCTTVQQVCGAVFRSAGMANLIPDCTSPSPMTLQPPQPEPNCVVVPPRDINAATAGLNLSAVPEGFVFSECPSPFVKDPLAKPGTTDTIDKVNCRFGCCIPCPAQNHFYAEGLLQNGLMAADILRSIAAVLSFFIFISFTVLPGKRKHPSRLIWNTSTAIFLYCMLALMALGDPKRLQCAADGIQQATQANNKLCAAQGSLLILAALASVMWCNALILNLHLHTVWRNSFLSNHYLAMSIVCWGAPLTFMCVAIGLGEVQFEYSHQCIVSVDRIFELFFYPMAACVIPGFLLHMSTFVYIAKVAIQESIRSEVSESLSNESNQENREKRITHHRHVLQAVKIQWRALLLVTVTTGIVMFYMLFYLTQINRMASLKRDPNAILPWIECMMTPPNTQTECHEVIKQYMPPFGIMIAAEIAVSFVGFSLFFNFIKWDLFREWNDFLYELRVKLGIAGQIEQNGQKFFAL